MSIKDLIDLDTAVVISNTLFKKGEIPKTPVRGTIQNWICNGKLQNRGYKSLGPQTGRPKVLVSKNDFINLLLNYPKVGRPTGWRKPKELRLIS